MNNKLLFGTIGVLLAVIATIGAVGLIQNPNKVTDISENASSAVQTVATDTARLLGIPSAPARVQEAAAEEASEQEQGNDDEEGEGIVQTPAPVQQPTQTPQPQTAGTYTLAQVAAHNSASSCYTAINGSVYDLTSFVRMHPGGSGAILSLCGRDGTAAFMAQHGGRGRPASELASLKIGTLAS